MEDRYATYLLDAFIPRYFLPLLPAPSQRRHIARQGSWGRIIGLTSGGELGFPGEVSYGAAKAAQVNYTMSAALELAPFGITANMVHPPVTDRMGHRRRAGARCRQHIADPHRQP